MSKSRMNAKERTLHDLGAALVSYADSKRTPDETERAVAFLHDFVVYSLGVGIHASDVRRLLRNDRWAALVDDYLDGGAGLFREPSVS